MAKKPSTGKATITQSSKDADGVETVHPIEEEQVVDEKPVVNPCVVGVSAGETIPTGNYANFKIGVSLSVTVEPGEVDEAFEFVSEWVADRISAMHDAVVQANGGE